MLQVRTPSEVLELIKEAVAPRPDRT